MSETHRDSNRDQFFHTVLSAERELTGMKEWILNTMPDCPERNAALSHLNDVFLTIQRYLAERMGIVTN